MSTVSLSVLQKGLQVLTGQIQSKKSHLEALLAKKQPISEENAQWLDQEANLIQEHRVIEILEQRSGDEKELDGLDEMELEAVRRLREAAGDLPKIVGKKRKRTSAQNL